MNCPFHILIFKSRMRSYRELPLRFFEFGTVYRYEKSGVVHGLTRVRGMTQDDAHIFCTKEQMAGELESLLDFVLDLLRDYGLDDFYLELSTKPEGKAVGTDEEWEEATEALRAAARGRWTSSSCSTRAAARSTARRSRCRRATRSAARGRCRRSRSTSRCRSASSCEYVGADNERHRPIMIHRALFGSIERFFAILLEHYAGAFPHVARAGAGDGAARSPTATTPYACRVADRLRAEGFRAEVHDAHADTLGARIRRAKIEKVPYVLVVGDDDVEHGTVGVNAAGQRRARARRRASTTSSSGSRPRSPTRER